MTKHENRVEFLLEEIRTELHKLNQKEGILMVSLAEARDDIVAAVAEAKATVEKVEAAILSAIDDLRAGTDTSAIADSLVAAAADLRGTSSGLGTAGDTLTGADPTP